MTISVITLKGLYCQTVIFETFCRISSEWLLQLKRRKKVSSWKVERLSWEMFRKKILRNFVLMLCKKIVGWNLNRSVVKVKQLINHYFLWFCLCHKLLFQCGNYRINIFLKELLSCKPILSNLNWSNPNSSMTFLSNDLKIERLYYRKSKRSKAYIVTNLKDRNP